MKIKIQYFLLRRLFTYEIQSDIFRWRNVICKKGKIEKDFHLKELLFPSKKEMPFIRMDMEYHSVQDFDWFHCKERYSSSDKNKQSCDFLYMKRNLLSCLMDGSKPQPFLSPLLRYTSGGHGRICSRAVMRYCKLAIKQKSRNVQWYLHWVIINELSRTRSNFVHSGSYVFL